VLQKGRRRPPKVLISHPALSLACWFRASVPIAGIVAELDVIEAEAKETDKALREILGQIGV